MQTRFTLQWNKEMCIENTYANAFVTFKPLFIRVEMVSENLKKVDCETCFPFGFFHLVKRWNGPKNNERWVDVGEGIRANTKRGKSVRRWSKVRVWWMRSWRRHHGATGYVPTCHVPDLCSRKPQPWSNYSRGISMLDVITVVLFPENYILSCGFENRLLDVVFCAEKERLVCWRLVFEVLNFIYFNTNRKLFC